MIKAHQVRALSASLAHYNQVPMEQVMDACSWAWHNTFTSFYLKNLSEEMNNGYRIGHIVANQNVVSLYKCIYCIYSFFVYMLLFGIYKILKQIKKIVYTL